MRNIVSLSKLTSAYGTNWQSTVCTKQFAIESSNCFESKCAVDSITNKAAVRKLVGERLTSLRHRHVGAVLRPLGPAAKLPGSNTSPTEQLTAPKLSASSVCRSTRTLNMSLFKSSPSIIGYSHLANPAFIYLAKIVTSSDQKANLLSS